MKTETSDGKSVRRGVSRTPFAEYLVRGARWITPIIVWIAGILFAVQLHVLEGERNRAVGIAVDQSVVLAQLEPGVVRKVYVKLHQVVEQGQVLVSMDDQAARVRLGVAQTDVKRLEAEVLAEEARLKAEDDRATGDNEDLARRFQWDREIAHLEYLNQLQQYAEDRMRLAGATVEAEIVRGLNADGFGSFREQNLADTEANALKARVEEQQHVMERARLAFEQADQRAYQFAERRRAPILYDDVLTPLRLSAEVRERELDGIILEIDALVLRSPIHGQVTRILAHGGERLLAGAELVSVSPMHAERVIAYLPEDRVLTARIGDPVRIRRAAVLDPRVPPIEGTIESVSAVVDELPARFRLLPNRPVWGRAMVIALNGGPSLLPGESVGVSLLTGPEE